MTDKTALFIVSGSEGYGVRQVWTHLVEGLCKQGWQLRIAVLDAEHQDKWATAYPMADVVSHTKTTGACTRKPGFYRTMLKRTINLFSQAKWINHLCQEQKTGALVVQVPLDVPLAGIAGYWNKIPTFWFVPNYISTNKPLDFNRRIYRFFFRWLKVIPVANSYFTDSTFGPGNFERHVIHLGVDPDNFRPAQNAGNQIRKKMGIPTDAIVIGLHARMTPSKGQDRLVEALAMSGLNAHLLLCGGPTEGAFYSALRARIAELGLDNQVHFAGFQRNLVPYYAACNIVANLRSDPEAFGLTVIEAMACGKPVLAHALGGPSETIIDGRTGWLIQDYKPDAIAQGLIRAVSDQDEWSAMGRRAREHVKKAFDQHLFINSVHELLRAKIAVPQSEESK
jgi:glycosyltransferase involved in cell wall biosynthesis